MVCVRDTTEFYEKIRSHANQSTTNSLHIFVAATYVDSLATLRILSDLLKQESIFYSVYPVYSYEDIQNLAKSLFQDDGQPYNAIFINCGGTKALIDEYRPSTCSKFFVLDSHRPVHLENIASDQVFVAWTEEDERQDPDVKELAVPENDDFDESDEDEYIDADVGQKRRRDRSSSLRGRKEEYRLRGTYYSRPTGCSMYDAAHYQRKDSNFHLWLACIALTDHFVNFRVPLEKYHAGCIELEQKVNSAGNLDKPRSSTIEGGVATKVPDELRIEYIEELRLMCLPRWSLFSSMEWSTFPCTRLKTWKDTGRRRLRLFFSELGIKHQHAQQKYLYMDSEIKSRLHEKVKMVASKYELDGFAFRSFQCSNGYKTQVSAPNLVYSVTALLESNNVAEQSDSFWIAAAALDVKGWMEVERGMDLAILVQEAIVRVGSYFMNNRSLLKEGRAAPRSSTNLRYVILERNPDSDLLAYPVALTRLIHFILEVLQRSGEPAPPMVAAAPLPNTSRSLIVGVMGKPSIQDHLGNKFGQAFGDVAKELDIEVNHHLFDSSYFELEQEQVSNFISRLSKVFRERTRVR